MYQSTPFRQLRQIYASILALGRLPAIAEEINSTLAAMTRAALEGRPASPPDSAAAWNGQHELDQFRKNLLTKIDGRMLCIDIGARWGADKSLLMLQEKAKLLCFDPDAEECARLQAHHSIEDIEYVPLALGADGQDLMLTITKDPACSSVYPPMEEIYQTYPALDVIKPERVVSVPSTTIDSYLADRGIGNPSLFKLDTQGSELDILKGAVNSLEDVCMLDIEVEFNPMYRGQALFGDVDQFLRSHGLVLWRLAQLDHYAPEHFPALDGTLRTIAAPPGNMHSMSPGNGQLFWAQAHYVRADCLASHKEPITEQLALRMAAIASAYGYWDLSLIVLDKCHSTHDEAAKLRAVLR